MPHFRYSRTTSTLTAILVAIFCTHCTTTEPSTSENRSEVHVTSSSGNFTLPEDEQFATFLNSENPALEPPRPDRWHAVGFAPSAPLVVKVSNCRQLDLLELVEYPSIGQDGTPSSYQYHPICGPDSNPCNNNQTVPSSVAKVLQNSATTHFAFTGICLDAETGDASSFISFMRREHY